MNNNLKEMNTLTYILAVVGAVTTATRLAGVLEKSGCKNVKVIRTPVVISSGGCSYSVRINEENLNELLEASSHRRLRVKKIYRVQEFGQECEYHDIS